MRELFESHRLLLVIAVILSVFLSLGTIAAAFVLESILNAAVSSNWPVFNQIIIQVALYLILITVLSIGSNLVGKKLIIRCVQTLRIRVYRGIISRDPEQFAQSNTATYLSALSNDVKIIEENILLPSLQVLQGGLIFLLAAAALFLYNPFIGGIMLVGLVAIYVLPAALGNRIGPRQQIYSQALDTFTTKIKDHFAGFEVMQSFGLKKRFENECSTLSSQVAQSKYGVDRLIGCSEGLSQMLGVALQLSVMLITAYLVMSHQLQAGALLAILQLAGCLIQPVALLMQNLPKIQGAQSVLAKLNGLASPSPSGFQGTAPASFERRISTDNLCFSYTDQIPILQNLNLTLEKGKKYALVGASGCGKTTLVKLLAASYSTYTGSIYLDEKELHTLDLSGFLNTLSFIHQEVFMFDESIADNISLHRNYPETTWHKALSQSGVDRFLDEVNNGLSTLVGENGSNLSGGQRQRIALARALMQNKPLLILDEATSAIDARVANSIEKALLSMQELTIISITHNLSHEVLGRYNAVLYMEEGSIKEQGSYEDLMNLRGSFFEYQQSEASKK